MGKRAVQLIAVVAVGVAVAWLLFSALPRWYGRNRGTQAAPAAPVAPAAPERKITATLYYIAEDGMSLVGMQREVPFGEPIAEQARRIVEAQLAAAPQPLAAAIPDGTTVRAVYVTERDCVAAETTCQRDAFVDLSGEARTKHTGGALDELFTIYAIVDALTVNLPVITRVQILVDGKEVDTLAGHVDLRHPLEKNLTWVKTEKEG
jgi:hypothetical protein